MKFSRTDKGLWWDRSWRVVSGCTKVSPACAHCWAERETAMRGRNPNPKIAERYGNGECTTHGKWNGQIRLAPERVLDEPLRTKKPAVWAVWNDLFHPDVPFPFVADVMDVICDERCLDDRFILLTKRPERWGEFISWSGDRVAGNRPFSVSLEVHGKVPNLGFGTTAENQEMADLRVPHVLKAYGVGFRVLSVEPMLGPVDLTRGPKNNLGIFGDMLRYPAMSGPSRSFGNRLNWVICGGESGPGARPPHTDWFRSLRDQCQSAGVPFFFKQWGEWMPVAAYCGPRSKMHKWSNPVGEEPLMARVGKKTAGRLLDGRVWDQVPEERP